MEKSKTKTIIESIFNKDADISCREMSVLNKKIYLFYIDCMINKELFTTGILAVISKMKTSNENIDLISTLKNEIIAIGSVKEVKDKESIQEEIFNGSVLLAVEGEKKFLAIGITEFQTRAISEPPSASVVRGPREGFIEDIETNLSMLRKRLKTPSLAVKRLKVGQRTSTKLALLYLDGVINPKIVEEVEKKISNIEIDGVIDSYYIEELLTTKNEMFFKKIGDSEKPDVICSKILEGRLAIIVDGSPIVLTVPYILFEDMQSPGDYYGIAAKTSFVRIIRLIGLLLGILLPGLYVALQSYHYRILPINFLITLLSSIEGISFPPVIEILFVLFLFDILNEASIRMPKQLGMALSIIGALILGDTAVQAGLITPPSIVVVAISGITLYIIPNQVNEASILRSLFTTIGGFSGFYGIFVCFIALVGYLVSIENYGTAYMSPYAPSLSSDKKDGFIKQPLNKMIYRPKSFSVLNKRKLKIKKGEKDDNK